MTHAVAPCKITPEQLNQAIEQLKGFVAIPSIGSYYFSNYNPQKMKEAARYITNLLHQTFASITASIPIHDRDPYVLAQTTNDANKPTVLFYGNFGVSKVECSQWEDLNPFVLKERDGRLYGHGASNGKGGIIAMIAALGTYLKENHALPFNAKFIFEGNEKHDPIRMKTILEKSEESLQPDVLIAMVGNNATPNTGTLTYSSRGIVELFLHIAPMDEPLDKGIGCLAPDLSIVLAQLMVDLNQPKNIPGFLDDCIPLTEEERKLLVENSPSTKSYKKDLGLGKKVPLRGDPQKSVYENIAEEPMIFFSTSFDDPGHKEDSIPNSISCKIQVRLTEGQDPEKIAEILKTYISQHPALKGFPFSMTHYISNRAWKGDPTKPYFKMYLEALAQNFEKVTIQPSGSNIPFLDAFQANSPKAEIIIPGVSDLTNAPCPIEISMDSQDPDILERSINSLLQFFHKMEKV